MFVSIVYPSGGRERGTDANEMQAADRGTGRSGAPKIHKQQLRFKISFPLSLSPDSHMKQFNVFLHECLPRPRPRLHRFSGLPSSSSKTCHPPTRLKFQILGMNRNCSLLPLPVCVCVPSAVSLFAGLSLPASGLSHSLLFRMESRSAPSFPAQIHSQRFHERCPVLVVGRLIH